MTGLVYRALLRRTTSATSWARCSINRCGARAIRAPNTAWALGAALGTAAAIGVAETTHAAAPIQANRALGPKHRIALTAWPINDDPKGHFSTIEQLFDHAKRSGYDGLELTVDDMRKSFFPGQSYEQIIRSVRAIVERTGVQIVGSLYHVSDGGWRREHEDGSGHRWDLDFNDPDFEQALREKLALDAAMGSEYVTFQISLPPKYLNTGGLYRDDSAYIQLSAKRIALMQRACFEQGLNFYVETHIDRISEDVEGFARIIDAAAPFEINADISHYVYRGIKKGPALQKILERVGHTHQRMAREHGDLSADVPDPEKDWASKGLTWQAFEAMRPCFKGGLSSRCVVGESGPMHLVEDAILLDAKLVPLYRLMALTCDAEVGGAAAPSAPGSAGTESPGSLDKASIAEAERILAQHFASTAPAPASSSAVISGGDMSTLEAERILAKHFGQ